MWAGKTKIDLFRDFFLKMVNFKVMNFIPVKVSTLYIQCIFLTIAIGNCMVKLKPPVNCCSDENIQTIFGTMLEDFLCAK
jgi:hypothetical protein